jgi:nicotinate-nucleotide adenylyltransferase
MNQKLRQAKEQFNQHELADSLETVNGVISGNGADGEAYLLRARIHYKMQRWGQAMNDYGSVLELDPANQEAKSGIEMARNILGYFTPDMFNP